MPVERVSYNTVYSRLCECNEHNTLYTNEHNTL